MFNFPTKLSLSLLAFLCSCNSEKAKTTPAADKSLETENKQQTLDLTTQLVSLKADATIADAKKILGNLKQGHGPFLWAPHPKKADTEFWCYLNYAKELYETPPTSPDLMRIAFISSASATDPNKQQVIWPKVMVGKSPQEALKKFYPHQKPEGSE